MKKTLLTAMLLFLACLVSSTCAIDRTATMIDTVSIEAASYKDLDYVGASLWVENVLAAPSHKWAILAGLGVGQYDADPGGTLTAWQVAMGIKAYLTPVTGISLVGSYQGDESDDFQVAAGTLTLKQRLAPASSAISPWIKGSVSMQSADLALGFLSSDNDDSFTAVVTTLGAGCDFMMNEDFAFVFSGGASDSENIDSGQQYADGFFFSLGMQYYWY